MEVRKSEPSYVIRHDGSRYHAKTYDEFLSAFMGQREFNSIEEKEEFLIGYIYIVAIIKDFRIKIYDDYRKYLKDKLTANEDDNLVCIDDLSSVIGIINKLKLATILELY